MLDFGSPRAVIQKTIMYFLIRALHSRGYGIEKVLIYGSGRTAGAFVPR